MLVRYRSARCASRGCGGEQHGVGFLVGKGGNLACGGNESATQRLARHNAGVVLDVAARWHLVDERGDVTGSPHVGEIARALQCFAEGNEVGRRAARGQALYSGIERAVGIAVKVVGAQKGFDLSEGIGIDDEAAQHALFGEDVLRQEFLHVTPPPKLRPDLDAALGAPAAAPGAVGRRG